MTTEQKASQELIDTIIDLKRSGAQFEMDMPAWLALMFNKLPTEYTVFESGVTYDCIDWDAETQQVLLVRFFPADDGEGIADEVKLVPAWDLIHVAR